LVACLVSCAWIVSKSASRWRSVVDSSNFTNVSSPLERSIKGRESASCSPNNGGSTDGAQVQYGTIVLTSKRHTVISQPGIREWMAHMLVVEGELRDFLRSFDCCRFSREAPQIAKVEDGDSLCGVLGCHLANGFQGKAWAEYDRMRRETSRAFRGIIYIEKMYLVVGLFQAKSQSDSRADDAIIDRRNDNKWCMYMVYMLAEARLTCSHSRHHCSPASAAFLRTLAG
jgi:hypothetical protein